MTGFPAPKAPNSVTIFKQDNGSGRYYLWFRKPRNTLFSQVLVNITDTDDGNTTEFSFQHNGKTHHF